ncbi:hypothetical protein ACFL1N_13020 [Thermodesulfobacteriota bacterium]
MGYKNVTGAGWKKDGDFVVFDLFQGNFIHTTELLQSPLEKGRHSIVAEFTHLYIGILNGYDLISSKLIRGTRVDFEDCLNLVNFHSEKIDIKRIIDHFNELVSYDVAETRLRPNIDHFLELLKEEGLYD